MNDKEQLFREAYQHLCDAQDLFAKNGEIQLMNAVKDLRTLADYMHYSTKQDNGNE